MRAREMLYKTVVQTVLSYYIKRWVITGEMIKAFHHRIARRLMGKTDRRVGEEGW